MQGHIGLLLIVLFIGVSVVLGMEAPKQCPSAAEEDPQHPVHLPHPTDCHKFYKCFKGKPVELDCPADHHWNIEKDYCDYPEEANCVRPLP